MFAIEFKQDPESHNIQEPEKYPLTRKKQKVQIYVDNIEINILQCRKGQIDKTKNRTGSLKIPIKIDKPLITPLNNKTQKHRTL